MKNKAILAVLSGFLSIAVGVPFLAQASGYMIPSGYMAPVGTWMQPGTTGGTSGYNGGYTSPQNAYIPNTYRGATINFQPTYNNSSRYQYNPTQYNQYQYNHYQNPEQYNRPYSYDNYHQSWQPWQQQCDPCGQYCAGIGGYCPQLPTYPQRPVQSAPYSWTECAYSEGNMVHFGPCSQPQPYQCSSFDCGRFQPLPELVGPILIDPDPFAGPGYFCYEGCNTSWPRY